MDTDYSTDFDQICSTAILRSGVVNVRSIRDALQRLVLTLIEAKDYSSFKKEDIVRDFRSFYSLSINSMVLGEIFPTLTKQRLLETNDRKTFRPNRAEIRKLNYLKGYEDFLLQRDMLIEEFVSFTRECSLPLSTEEAKYVISSFVEASISSLGISPSAGGKISDEQEYLVSTFIKDAKDNERPCYSVFENILVGRMLASFITSGSKTSNEQISIFRDINFYLDSGIVFNLLGLNNYSTAEEYQNMVSTLRGLGAKFWIFDHVFNELYTIIETTLFWIGRHDFSREKASRVNEFFLSNNWSKEDIEEYLHTLESKLADLGIFVLNTDIDYNEPDTLFQADIKNMITEEYRKSGGFLEEKEQTYEIDAKSLYAIHKLRKRKAVVRFQDVRHLLLTTNRGLSRVANRIRADLYCGRGVPYCVTDTFLSLLLFFTYSDYSKEVNERFCIPAAFHAFEPGRALVKKIETVLADIQRKGLMTPAESTSWKTDKVLSDYVLRETNNNPDNFDENTPRKVIDLIREEANDRIAAAEENASSKTKEAEKTFLAFKKISEENQKLRLELMQKDEEEKNRLSRELAGINANIARSSRRAYWVVVSLLFVACFSVAATFLWLADFLKTFEDTFLIILSYIFAVGAASIPFFSLPFLAGKALAERIRKKKTTKYSSRIEEIRNRISEIENKS